MVASFRGRRSGGARYQHRRPGGQARDDPAAAVRGAPARRRRAMAARRMPGHGALDPPGPVPRETGPCRSISIPRRPLILEATDAGRVTSTADTASVRARLPHVRLPGPRAPRRGARGRLDADLSRRATTKVGPTDFVTVRSIACDPRGGRDAPARHAAGDADVRPGKPESRDDRPAFRHPDGRPLHFDDGIASPLGHRDDDWLARAGATPGSPSTSGPGGPTRPTLATCCNARCASCGRRSGGDRRRATRRRAIVDETLRLLRRAFPLDSVPALPVARVG